jgi:uncharacterized membrane protein YkvA (DUF1232 family)
MPMKVTFELSDRDLRHLRALVKDASQRFAVGNEEEIVAAAQGLVATMSEEEVPDFVRERVLKLEALIEMLRDEEWAMSGDDRGRVVKALAYFAEPEDLIPDRIPGLGFLDDAIIVELVVQDLRPELDAYADFCKFRLSRSKLLGKSKSADPVMRGEWLEGRRKQLQSRMRRRRRSRGSGGRGGPSVKLW